MSTLTDLDQANGQVVGWTGGRVSICKVILQPGYFGEIDSNLREGQIFCETFKTLMRT